MESEVESDICEPKAAKTARPSRKKSRKINSIERQSNASSDEHNDNVDGTVMTDSQTSEEHCDNVRVTEFQIESVSDADVPGNTEDKFGAMVSSKLLLMSPLQRLMAQKIISEILLQGQLGMLKSSLSPVLVAGYMKSTANEVITDCSSSSTMGDDSNDCDPLMFQVNQRKVRDRK